MRYNKQTEATIVEQIKAAPDRPVILPDWAYRNGEVTVTVDGVRTRLHRRMYELLIQPLPDHVGLRNPPGVDPRNVNPHLCVLLRSRKAHTTCRNGHVYTDEDWVPGVGHRCNTCRKKGQKGTPSPPQINAEKTHCPAGHEYTRENTMRYRNGKRRCRTCNKAQQVAYRNRNQRSTS